MMYLQGVLLSASLFVSFSRAALYTDFAQLPTGVAYDFIIIGGGTAGNVLANRLTENTKFNVLVLEAGPPYGNITTQVPFLAPELASPNPYDWNYTTVSLPGLNGRSIPYPRGRILGGSSTTNWLVYTRGSAEDWNRYATVTGDQGWSWKSILPYFKKSEKWNSPTDHHNTTGQFDPTVHGHGGFVGTSLASYKHPEIGRAVSAAKELGEPYSFNLDYNDGSPLGIGYAQGLILNGERSSSASSYLGPKYITRQNLSVLVGVHVSRILKTSINHVPTSPYTFLGVEFRDGTGAVRQLSAMKEVILSAGAIGTPQILLNSGIGKTQDLKAVNITPLVDLPSVGENLSDHAVIGNLWLVNTDDTYETFRRNSAPYLDRWQNNRTGPFADAVVDFIGFARNPVPPSPDPSAGPNTPHFELIVSNGIPPDILPPKGNFLTYTTVLVAPASRGSIKLASSDPFASPLIDTGFFTDTAGADLANMRAALRYAEAYSTAKAWSGWVGASASNLTGTMTDEELDRYIRESSGTLFHPVGTASMSRRGSEEGVVDPDLRVKKVKGVRVVDVSVLPFVPSAHTCAAAFAVAERAADMIKSAYVH